LKSEIEKLREIDRDFQGKIQKMKHVVEKSIKKMIVIATWTEIYRFYQQQHIGCKV